MRSLAKCVFGLFAMSAVALVFSGSVAAQGQKKAGKAVTLKVGSPAPAFKSVNENGKPFDSTSVVGKKVVVLYFYPADFTGGCTKQACGFRDNIENLKSKNAAVYGISGDSVATHKLFRAHEKLNFHLLADEKGEVAKAFGIPYTTEAKKSPAINEKGEKVPADRAVTISRYTVVIGLDGNIAAIDQVGNAGGDAKRIEDLVSKLEKK
jgi:thioredoxin-dependent peroxiredoxin